MLKEFKGFAMKGSVLDMAIGIIIGGALSPIVKSLVDDVLMPPIGMLMGGVNFSDLYFNLGDTARESLALAVEAGDPIIKYGAFIQTVLDFIIIAFAIFMVVKAMNASKKKEEEVAEATTKECPRCLSQIAIKATRCPNCTSDV